jgi:hypothetical protein
MFLGCSIPNCDKLMHSVIEIDNVGLTVMSLWMFLGLERPRWRVYMEGGEMMVCGAEAFRVGDDD